MKRIMIGLLGKLYLREAMPLYFLYERSDEQKCQMRKKLID